MDTSSVEGNPQAVTYDKRPFPPTSTELQELAKAIALMHDVSIGEHNAEWIEVQDIVSKAYIAVFHNHKDGKIAVVVWAAKVGYYTLFKWTAEGSIEYVPQHEDMRA